MPDIEDEIARAMRYAIRPDVPVHLPVPRMYEDMTAALAPLLNRVRAEALREAANWMQIGIGEPYHPDEDALLRKHWHARRKYLYDRADRIEQNSEGNET